MSSIESLRKELASRLEEIAARLFGPENLDAMRGFLVEKPQPSKLLALPRPRTVNVFIAVEAMGELLIRHEGGEDFVEFEVAGYNVPAILNTKLQAAERRILLRMLYDHYDRNRQAFFDAVADYARSLGLAKPAERLASGAWRCYLAPKQGSKEEEEVVVPYCGFCPGCMIYGYAGMDEAGYNVKSRVEGDVFYGLCPSSRCVVQRTFNAVDDATKTTFYGGGETGALYQLSLIEPGTVFVGKIALRDMSLAELLAVLAAIANIERIGGRQTHFGRVKTHIAAMVFSRLERGSGYEAAAEMLTGSGGGKLGLEEALQGLVSYAERVAAPSDLLVSKRGLADELRRLSLEELDAILAGAWLDALTFKASLEMFVRDSRKKR